ncbi:MAG: hypothetical protein LBU16_03440 [Treponema sp.]|nr:hypothetical protein [Treponema sp.]
MQMLDMDTIKTLEARQDFIMEKSSRNTMDENSFSAKELRALRNATNFIKWVVNNSSDDMVQKITEKYNQEISDTSEDDNIEINNNKNALLPGTQNVFHEASGKNRKIQIIVSEYGGVNFIQLELLGRRAARPLWRKIAYIRITLHKFEKILKKVYAIVNKEEASPADALGDGRSIQQPLVTGP